MAEVQARVTRRMLQCRGKTSLRLDEIAGIKAGMATRDRLREGIERSLGTDGRLLIHAGRGFGGDVPERERATVRQSGLLRV
ncbi:MAG: hypothetical protein IT467_09810 [Dokdonella sp.]|uniref:hypothetical protein n=1 Tax=Dokdonella sp. TaxID=2291710 RepID=UPI0025B88957|nr:hypothetical protein [Dokdonella sp.]MBZ0222176.1 hypothetical protein [Dokdonella sp.]MCC7256207.1 hypothetical protein [Dokdonella sp.]